MLVVIDNYDSFTYNLVQYLGELYRGEIRVFRNNKVTPGEIGALKPTHVVISPGPCTPKEAGISVGAVKTLGPAIPLLGVCLGHQSIGAAFGGRVVRAPYLMHGKVSAVHHKGTGIYKGLPNPFTATRYHSLIIERSTCPDCLEITSETEDGIIMGVKHKKYPVVGVQFHPEAILTEGGKTLLKNFLAISK
ncbi:MAG: aminodeoxychorismate/anthranilate synthase component II [Chitinispirillaceae bacterium]|nr:aminodeoxychorismate/anthranilate synthase component II [Chitinispirillaceae bacterium]